MSLNARPVHAKFSRIASPSLRDYIPRFRTSGFLTFCFIDHIWIDWQRYACNLHRQPGAAWIQRFSIPFVNNHTTSTNRCIHWSRRSVSSSEIPVFNHLYVPSRNAITEFSICGRLDKHHRRNPRHDSHKLPLCKGSSEMLTVPPRAIRPSRTVLFSGQDTLKSIIHPAVFTHFARIKQELNWHEL